MDGRSTVEGCIRHPSQHDSAARTLEHDSALIIDKVDKRNPHRARDDQPRIDSPSFRVVLGLQSVAAFQNHGDPKPGPWDAENAKDCEFAIDRMIFPTPGRRFHDENGYQ